MYLEPTCSPAIGRLKHLSDSDKTSSAHAEPEIVVESLQAARRFGAG